MSITTRAWPDHPDHELFSHANLVRPTLQQARSAAELRAGFHNHSNDRADRGDRLSINGLAGGKTDDSRSDLHGIL